MKALSFMGKINTFLFLYFSIGFPALAIFGKHDFDLWIILLSFCAFLLTTYSTCRVFYWCSEPYEIERVKKDWNILMQWRPTAITFVCALTGYLVMNASGAILIQYPDSVQAFIGLVWGASIILFSMWGWIHEIPRNDTLFNFKLSKIEGL